jgi:hypothetical protein
MRSVPATIKIENRMRIWTLRCPPTFNIRASVLYPLSIHTARDVDYFSLTEKPGPSLGQLREIAY